jgi:leucyl-tRNA synthetase
MRIWRLVEEHAGQVIEARGFSWDGTQAEVVRSVRRQTHQTIARVTHDLEDAFHFNTALAALMEHQTALARFADQVFGAGGATTLPKESLLAFAEGAQSLLVMLAPFAPHVAEELWEMLGHRGSIFHESWPAADPILAQEEQVEVVVQVNGKVRARLHVPRGTSEEQLRLLALGDPRARPWIHGKAVRRVVVVPDKLVSVVVAS